MKTRLVLLSLAFLMVLLGICLLYSKQILMPEGVYLDQTRNTDGTLSFAVRTVTYNGAYAPRHVFAIWITNSSNQFIKTIKVCGSPYRSMLVKWVASSGNNTTGAITSASLNSHQLHNVTWNGQTYQNNVVPDGDYNVNIEFAEHNATTNNPGKYKVVTFPLGATPVDTVPTPNTWFTNMHLVWTPVIANGTIAGTVTTSTGSPLAGATITAGTITATSTATGSYTLPIAAGTYSVTCSKTGYTSQTVNNIVVTSNQTTSQNFSLVAANGTITGLVKNAQDAPLAGAEVTVGTQTTTTLANGTFTLSITPGTYSVSCAAAGYITQTQNNIVITSNQTSTVNFTLAPVGNEDETVVKFTTVLKQNSPNPFRTFTNIRYYAAKNAPVSLNVYNTKGQLVARLINAPQSKGWHETFWNGYTSSGKKAVPGKYFYRLSSGGTTLTKTLTLTD